MRRGRRRIGRGGEAEKGSLVPDIREGKKSSVKDVKSDLQSLIRRSSIYSRLNYLRLLGFEQQGQSRRQRAASTEHTTGQRAASTDHQARNCGPRGANTEHHAQSRRQRAANTEQTLSSGHKAAPNQRHITAALISGVSGSRAVMGGGVDEDLL